MTRKKKSGHDTDYPQKIGEILPKALRQRNITIHLKDQRLCDAWARAVGKTISAQTMVDRLERDTLFVKVSSPAWIQQLQFMKSDILKQLNTIPGCESISNIFFSIGEIPPVQRKKSASPPMEPDNRLLKSRDRRLIEECTAAIPDAELGEILRRAMTRTIIRRNIINRPKSP